MKIIIKMPDDDTLVVTRHNADGTVENVGTIRRDADGLWRHENDDNHGTSRSSAVLRLLMKADLLELQPSGE